MGEYITYTRSLAKGYFIYTTPAASASSIRFATATIYRITTAEYHCFKVISK